MSKDDIDKVLRQIEEATKREEKAQWGDGVTTAYHHLMPSGILIYMAENNHDVVPLIHLPDGVTPDQGLVDALNYRLGLTPEDAMQVWQSVKDADRSGQGV
jgi:hypothetical protein